MFGFKMLPRCDIEVKKRKVFLLCALNDPTRVVRANTASSERTKRPLVCARLTVIGYLVVLALVHPSYGGSKQIVIHGSSWLNRHGVIAMEHFKTKSLIRCLYFDLFYPIYKTRFKTIMVSFRKALNGDYFGIICTILATPVSVIVHTHVCMIG